MNLALIAVFSAISFCVGEPSVVDFKGQAYDLKKQNPVYTEEYRQSFQNNKHTGTTTCYRDPQGHEIAERTLDFSRSDLTPDYVLKDLRDGYEEGADIKGNQVHVFCRTTRNSDLKEKTLSVPEPYVIDGGFNNFLKQNWNTLIAGKTIHFNFVAPARLNYFAFIAHQCDSTATTRTFSVEVDSRLLRLLVPPIVVTYNSSTKMMTQYQGISNINDDKGKSLKVKLVYPEKGP